MAEVTAQQDRKGQRSIDLLRFVYLAEGKNFPPKDYEDEGKEQCSMMTLTELSFPF